jgi:hypothetical protein
MVIQKQMAANHFSLPQSSTLIQDDDDDPSVNEVAHAYNTSEALVETEEPPPQFVERYENDDPDTYYETDVSRDDGLMYNEDQDEETVEGGRPSQRRRRNAPSKGKGGFYAVRSPHPVSGKSRGSAWDEVKLVVVLIVVFLSITFIPVDVLIDNYAPSLSSAGYAPILIKAVLMAVSMAVLVKVMGLGYGSGSSDLRRDAASVDDDWVEDENEDFDDDLGY